MGPFWGRDPGNSSVIGAGGGSRDSSLRENIKRIRVLIVEAGEERIPESIMMPHSAEKTHKMKNA